MGTLCYVQNQQTIEYAEISGPKQTVEINKSCETSESLKKSSLCDISNDSDTAVAIHKAMQRAPVGAEHFPTMTFFVVKSK